MCSLAGVRLLTEDHKIEAALRVFEEDLDWVLNKNCILELFVLNSFAWYIVFVEGTTGINHHAELYHKAVFNYVLYLLHHNIQFTW